MYVLICKEMVSILCVCVQYGVGMLVLDVGIVRFCVDILSIVDICLLLVVQEFFLCNYVVSVLVYLFLVECYLLL